MQTRRRQQLLNEGKDCKEPEICKKIASVYPFYSKESPPKRLPVAPFRQVNFGEFFEHLNVLKENYSSRPDASKEKYNLFMKCLFKDPNSPDHESHVVQKKNFKNNLYANIHKLVEVEKLERSISESLQALGHKLVETSDMKQLLVGGVKIEKFFNDKINWGVFVCFRRNDYEAKFKNLSTCATIDTSAVGEKSPDGVLQYHQQTGRGNESVNSESEDSLYKPTLSGSESSSSSDNQKKKKKKPVKITGETTGTRKTTL
jgi:hypothetical protein